MRMNALLVASLIALVACSAPASETPQVADPVAAASADTTEIGPALGVPAPAVSLIDTTGNRVALSGLAGTSGIVVAFVRSAEWCPFCQQQMLDLDAAVGPLETEGWTLVAVSYDTPETLANFAADKALTYPLLSDPGSSAIKAFHLLNTEMPEDTKYFGVPHPAIVFIAADGTVKAVLREEGYKIRPAVDVIIETAAGL